MTSTTMATAAPVTAATTVVIRGHGCDPHSNSYLVNSPGTVESLTVCSELCQASSQCQSLTFYPDQHCSHFSTPCTSVVAERGATAVRFPSAPPSTVGWALVGYGQACDFDPGEMYSITSSGEEVATLRQCLDSCDQSTTCQSVVYYEPRWCRHLSSSCENTKSVEKAVSFTKLFKIIDV